MGGEPDRKVNECSRSCFPVPLEAPLNVGVLLENSTAIRVTWAAVDKETVRGHLLGYKVPPLLYLLMNNKRAAVEEAM